MNHSARDKLVLIAARHMGGGPFNVAAMRKHVSDFGVTLNIQQAFASIDLLETTDLLKSNEVVLLSRPDHITDRMWRITPLGMAWSLKFIQAAKG